MAPNFVQRKKLSLGSKGDVWCISINTECRRVVFGMDDKTLPVWDLNAESRITTLTGHEGNIWATSLSNDGIKVISGSDDNRVRIWM
jgi:WD40 repeat protein